MKLFSRSLVALALGATLAGCGGGNGSSPFKTDSGSTPTPVPPGVALTGKTATRAILASGYQSFHAAINYPYAGIQLALPASSPFRASKSNRTKSIATVNEISAAQFNPDLNLYQTVATKGSVTTINFYSDAALTKSAGNSVLTAPGNQSVGGNYVSYPAVVKITQNITAGNLPCQGSGTITFTGGSGANKLDGTLSLPKTGLKVTANLTLSDAGQVGGTTTIVGNGQTITLSGLSGPIDGDIAGKANVVPGNTTGTGVVNVLTGKFEITLNTPDGKATGTANPDGSLGIHFPDGLAEKLASPLASVGGQNPTTPTATATPKPTTSPTSGPTPTVTATPAPTAVPVTTVYGVPVKLQATGYLLGLNNSNHYVGGINGTTSTGDKGFQLFSSPTANGQTFVNSANITATGFNNNDKTVGYNVSTSQTSAYFWPIPLVAPIEMKPFVADNRNTFTQGLNDSEQIVGYDFDNFGSGSHALYWSSPTATPIALQPLMPNGTTTAAALVINSKGQIVGSSADASSSTAPVYWSSATATPQALPRLDGQSSFFQIAGINTQGNIFIKGDSGLSSFYSSHSAQPVLLPYLPGVNANGINRNDYGAALMNASGVVVGASPRFVDGQVVGKTAVRWLTAGGQIKVQDLNSLIPANSGWQLTEADFINDNGVIIGQGNLNGFTTAFYLAPK